MGHARTINYDPFTYMPVSARDDIGLLGSYEWDNRGSPSVRRDGLNAATSFTYDSYCHQPS